MLIIIGIIISIIGLSSLKQSMFHNDPFAAFFSMLILLVGLVVLIVESFIKFGSLYGYLSIGIIILDVFIANKILDKLRK